MRQRAPARPSPPQYARLAARCVAFIVLFARIAAHAQPAPEAATTWRPRPLATARHYMVAAANPLAAEAGREILRKGGTAVDAAIAVQLVLGLVEPQSSGLGGGAFLLHWDASAGRLASYDGRETAPAAAKGDRFLPGGRPMPFERAVKSALSIGTPGVVLLLEHAHRRHGKLEWAELFAPAIRLAEQGFTVSSRFHNLLLGTTPASFSDAARAYFYDERGRPRPVGHRLANPGYAATLREIAAGGAAAFYGGRIASEIIDAARTEASAGRMLASDLTNYRIEEREPLCTAYRGNRVCTMGPPSSAGHALAQVLGLVEPFDLGGSPRSAMAGGAMHVLGEALKLAFADRARYLADPGFVKVPAGLIDADYIADRRRLIARSHAIAVPHPGTPPGRDGNAFAPDATIEVAGTSHISIVDAAGNAVAMTTTIESAFGSGRWAAGFLLNNELTDFSFRPAADGRPVANRIEGGKRPRSSMAPTIVFGPDGRFLLATGSAGGSRIIPYVLKVLVAVLDWKMDAASATALPNFAAQGRYFELERPSRRTLPFLWDSTAPLAVVSDALALKPYGQSIVFEDFASGTQLVVRRADGTLEGAADPRREGVAVGD